MQSILYLLLLLALAIKIESLSYPSYMHADQTADQQAYLKQLIEIENNLGNQLNTFEQLVNSVNKNISSYEGLTTIQTQALQPGISTERSSIYQMSSQLVLPLEKKTWACQLLNQTEQDNIRNLISSAQKNITTLESKLEQEALCQRNNQILSEIQFLNNYIEHLGQQISNNCPPIPIPTPNSTDGGNTTPIIPPTPPTPPKIALVPYSQNKNFIYGTQGESGYVKSLQNLLDQGYIKKQCTPQAPFPKSNQNCVSCPDDKQHFYDLTVQSCLTCPNGYLFIRENRTCLVQQMNSNSNAKNYIGQFPSVDSSLSTCQIQNPFFNGTHCIGCSSPAFFDFKQKICKICPNGTTFDNNTHLCIYQKFNSFLQEGVVNYCCGSITTDPTAQSCPKEKPFFNGKQCIECNLPAYFSLQSATCTLCNSGFQFSAKQKNCLENKYFEQYSVSYVKTDSNVAGADNFAGTPPVVDSKYENVVACDASHPFVQNGACIQCQSPNYFNYTVNQCEACPENQKFDSVQHKCLKIVSQKMNSNMEYITNFAGIIPAYDSQVSTCPKDTPFFNGNQCIECKLPKYINFQTSQCKSCDSDKIFSTENGQCIVTDPKFMTDLNSSNIYYIGNFQDWQQKQQALLKDHPNIQKCPGDKPYFNFGNNSCQVCSNDYPLYDIKYNRCIRCENSEYNPESRVCIVYGGINPTIQRFMMNTAGWI